MVEKVAKLLKGPAFNTKLLEFIVCPLAKTPLRYCEKSQELFNASIGVAYPIVDGIPLLSPVNGRILESAKDADTPDPN
ncbi:unnamed protein product [Calypogeia fissa]